jgi:hypothetical protein
LHCLQVGDGFFDAPKPEHGLAFLPEICELRFWILCGMLCRIHLCCICVAPPEHLEMHQMLEGGNATCILKKLDWNPF